MANTILTNSLIAKEALAVLENEMVMGNLVHRGYEDEFDNKMNGYQPGATITIKKPPKYTLREGATMSVQDSTEGTTSLSVDYQFGVDIGGWTSADRTMKLKDFSKRFIQPAVKRIAQGADAKIMTLYKNVWNWVGTPSSTIDSFADFARGPQRLDEMAVPQDDRYAVLSAADHWGMVGNFTGLYINDTAKTALQKAKLPMLGGVESYMTQNVPSHTTGARDDTTPLTRGAQSTTYAATKDTNYFDLATDGWDSATTIKAGDVFTIDGVYAVNPVSKAVMTYLQQFVVVSDVTADGTTSNQTTVRISPAPIFSGAYQNVYSATGDTGNDKAIVNVGSATTSYRQNMVFHKNAFAACFVPLIKPEGAVDVSRETYNGLSIRMIPVYTGSDDTGAVRLDVLMGAKAIYPDLATRING